MEYIPLVMFGLFIVALFLIPIIWTTKFRNFRHVTKRGNQYCFMADMTDGIIGFRKTFPVRMIIGTDLFCDVFDARTGERVVSGIGPDIIDRLDLMVDV